MQVRVAFWERLNPDIVNSIRCKLYILACLPCVQLCITYKLFSNCSALKPCIPLVWQCDKWTMKTAWSQKERKLLTLCFSFLSPVYINYKYPQGTEEGMVLRWKVILTALNTKCRGIRNILGKWLPWQCLDTWIHAFEFYCDVFTTVSCLFCTFTMYSDVIDMRMGVSMLYEEHYWFIVNQRGITVDNIVCVLYVL